MSEPLPVLHTLDAVAKHLGVSLRTVKRFVASGKLPARKFGRTVRVMDGDLRAFLEQGTAHTQTREPAEAPAPAVSGAATPAPVRQPVEQPHAGGEPRLGFQVALATAKGRPRPKH
jgi:excisionase family DNA binding protein